MKNIKTVSIVLALVLSLSLISSSFEDTIPSNDKLQDSSIKFIEKSTESKITKHLTINLEEKTTKFVYPEVQLLLVKKPTMHNRSLVQLSEDISVSNDDGSQTQIRIVKHDRYQTMLDRLFGYRKMEFDNVIGLPLFDNTITTSYSYIMTPLDHSIGVSDDYGTVILQSTQQLIPADLHDTNLFAQGNDNQFTINFDNQIKSTLDLFGQYSTTLLPVFAITAFYVIVRSDNLIIQTKERNRIFCAVFICLLISTMVVTPLSISSSYYAYGESPENSTDTIDESVNPDRVLPPDYTIRYNYSVSDDYSATNSTQTLDTQTNSTQTVLPVPEPVASLDSDIVQNNTKYVGEVSLNQTGFVIDGGYVQLENNETNNNSNFTISTWIKPDYQSAYTVYTIASKQNIFKLVLNNVAVPNHKIDFSVFDGSKWYSVRSTTKITENWIYLTATFDGDTLSLYTNGTINSKFSINAANLESKSYSSIESELVDTTSDILIGATSDLRVDENTANSFYGIVDKFAIYNELLTKEQILQIYEDTLSEIENKLTSQPKSIQDIEQVPIDLLTALTNSTITQKIELNSTEITLDQSLNSTLNTNSTEFIIVPQFETTNTFTLSVWVTPDYSKGSDEFTIFAKEKAFMLSINNAITPSRAPKFSVFDGIKWTDVIANAKVEGLTHIAAVVNGTEIYLYVNGILEQQATIADSIRITQGKSALVPSEIADSDSNIVIGAYMSTLRKETTLTNQFSGIIDEPQFFDSALDQSKIKAIYHQRFLDEFSIHLYELVSMTDELSTTSAVAVSFLNTTINLNGTLPELVPIPIEPKIDSIKSTYLITENPEFELELFNDTAAILKQKQELRIATSILANTTQTLTQTVNTTNETDSQAAETPAVFGWIFYIIPRAHAEENQVSDSIEIEHIKQEVQDIQTQISNIDSTDNISKETIVEATEQIKVVTDKLSQIANSQDPQTRDELQESLDKIKDITENDPEPIQEDQWIENDDSIITEIYDPSGSVVSLRSTFEKIRDGKFKIALSADDIKKPGLYRIKTIVTIDGEQYTTEKEFAWGLVSLNTKKSIYKPGETADLIIVVLDNQGHPVCDANLSVSIQSPDLQTTLLDSDNGITRDTECGLYNSQYIPSVNGTYNVNVHAISTNIDTTFDTTFDAREQFDYDIIRTAQSKVDPVTNPNQFTVRIDVESFLDSNNITITEKVPAVFEIVTDANVVTEGKTKILTWSKNLQDSKTFVEYSYSIPLEFPQLYALGPLEISSESGSFTEARSWFVAADPILVQQNVGGILVYTDATAGTPKYRIYNNTATTKWGSEQSAASTGVSNIDSLMIKAATTRDEFILVARTADVITVQINGTHGSAGTRCWGDGTTCGSVLTLATAASAVDSQAFDVAYETNSGDAIVVYTTNTDTNRPHYRIWNGTGWTADAAISQTRLTGGTLEWIKLAPDLQSDKIALAFSDSNDDLSAIIWSGSTWNTEPGFALDRTLTASDTQKFDLSYEGASGDLIIFSGDTATTLTRSILIGSTWSNGTTTTTQIPTMVDVSEDFNATTNRVGVSWTEVTGNDAQAAVWDGSSTVTLGCNDASIDTVGNFNRGSAVAVSGNFARNVLVVYADSASVNIDWCTATEAATPVWTAQTDINTVLDPTTSELSIRLFKFPKTTSVLMISSDRAATADLLARVYDVAANTWTETEGGTALETELSGTGMNFDFAFKRRDAISLTERLGITDTVSIAQSKSLTERLGITDTITKSTSKSLTERLGMTDTLTKSPSISLTERLGITDTVSTSPSISLTERLGITDTVSTSVSKSLTESLGLTDTLTKSPSISLTERLGMTDTLTTSPSISLTERLGITDTVSTSVSKSLSESLGL
ncbi:MAG: LamG-like jellyroll fold domain-containing protein, partial [Candidatus Nitrosotenuis sp.]